MDIEPPERSAGPLGGPETPPTRVDVHGRRKPHAGRAHPMRFRRAAPKAFRGALSVLTIAVAGVFVVTRRRSLAISMQRLSHSSWSWIVLGIALETLSLTSFAQVQRRLLRVGGM